MRVDIEELKQIVIYLRRDGYESTARTIELAIDDLMELRISSDAGLAATQALNQQLDDMRARLQSAEDAIRLMLQVEWKATAHSLGLGHFARYGGVRVP